MRLRAEFKLDDEYAMEKLVHEIFDGHEFVGSGYNFVDDIRDIEYDVSDVVAQSVAQKLIKVGCRVDCP